jgi:hypothetical protein
MIWCRTVRATRICSTPARVWGRRRLNVAAAQLRFGQPLHETHGHLLKAGEGATVPRGLGLAP